MKTLRRRTLGTLLLALAASACTPGTGRNTSPVGAPKPSASLAAPGPGRKAPPVRSARRADPLAEQQLSPVAARGGLLAPPAVSATRNFIALGATPGNATGSVSFLKIDDDFFRDSAAFRLQAAVGPAEHALITVSTLGEELYTRNGVVVQETSGADGGFSLTGLTPAGKPFVVNAAFARGHRLSAIAPAGASTIAIDEATTMVAELARWQLLPFAMDDQPDVTDLPAGDLEALHTQTRTLLADVPLASSGGAAPSVDALKIGSGHVLRNRYVEAFGATVSAAGTTLADQLSDAWRNVLGFRPLAFTRMAGNGIRGYNQSDDQPATEVSLTTPIDAVEDHLGNVWLTQYDVGLISLVPKANLPWAGVLASSTTTLDRDKLYTVAGVVNSSGNPLDWDFFYAQDSDNDPEGAPPVANSALHAPYKLALEKRAGGDESHLYFTQPFTGRVMLMPTEDVTHFGRALKKDHLYCVAGVRTFDSFDPFVPLADGDAATDGGLYFPTGLQRDAAGNLWVLDSGNTEAATEADPGAGAGGIVIVREADGQAFRLPLRQNGVAYGLDLALDLRLDDDEQFVYVADTKRHWVFKFPMPTPGDIAGWTAGSPPAPCEIERVAGKRDKKGYLDDSVAGVLYPDIHDVSDGIPDPAGDLIADGGAVSPDDVTALLNLPGSIAFDANGDLVIGDTGNGRIRLKADGQLFTIAGGLDTRFITGDSRLAYLPGIANVNRGLDGSILVADRREAVVRRLHSQRSIR